ncbi:MAG: crotonase/enoyl-CoA hydratase family protein [Litoreibacter sp.]|nr:crotonase/enoyl-CoA hydratase family protein [Litoreibacter sp.]
MFDTIEIEIDARGVATLSLARPDKRNAMSAEMIDDLARAADRLGSDPQVRVVVLAAHGSTFCAGGDLNWMRVQMVADAVTRREEAETLALMLRDLNEMPKPLIGRVHGNAFGGGLGLMSVCDCVIAADTARFGFTETRLGLIPATIGPYVIARMGEANARRVFMSSRIFDAQEAGMLGLVGHVVGPEALDVVLETEVAAYLACAPGAVAEAKALARAFGPVVDRAAIDRSIDALVTRWEDPESDEGIAAFFEKRAPEWGV